MKNELKIKSRNGHKYTVPFSGNQEAIDFVLQQNAASQQNDFDLESSQVSVPQTPPHADSTIHTSSPLSTPLATPRQFQHSRLNGSTRQTPRAFRPVKKFALSHSASVANDLSLIEYSPGRCSTPVGITSHGTAFDILKSAGARTLLLLAHLSKPLTPERRMEVIQTLADHFVRSDRRLTKSICQELESEVLKLFPGEIIDDYRKRGDSKIYIRYRNKKYFETHKQTRIHMGT